MNVEICKHSIFFQLLTKNIFFKGTLKIILVLLILDGDVKKP